MSCGCKNKEYHPCQHGKPCECGGKCKEDNYFNVVSSINEFKDESRSIKRGVLFLAGGLALAVIGYMIYKEIS